MKESAELLKKKEVCFQVSAKPGSEVCVAGTFNGWKTGRNRLKDNPDSGHYKTTVALSSGRYEYKFVVNGEWIVDPNCHEVVSNPLGSQNNVIHV